MTSKMPHAWKKNPIYTSCVNCGALQSWAEKKTISNRCTGQANVMWRGANSNDSFAWKVGDTALYDMHVPYDPEYDIVETPVVITGTVIVSGEIEKKPQHVMGLSPEEIDWAAYKAFMRELQT